MTDSKITLQHRDDLSFWRASVQWIASEMACHREKKPEAVAQRSALLADALLSEYRQRRTQLAERYQGDEIPTVDSD